MDKPKKREPTPYKPYTPEEQHEVTQGLVIAIVVTALCIVAMGLVISFLGSTHSQSVVTPQTNIEEQIEVNALDISHSIETVATQPEPIETEPVPVRTYTPPANAVVEEPMEYHEDETELEQLQRLRQACYDRWDSEIDPVMLQICTSNIDQLIRQL